MEKTEVEKKQTFKKINKKEKDNNTKVNDKKKITSRYLLIFNQPDKSNKNIRPDNIFKIIDELKKINSIKNETAIYKKSPRIPLVSTSG